MALYPDRRSAALPALAAAQRLHGWCSPEAIEQVACVMGVTPAYLEAVATLLRHARDRARRPPQRLRVHEHLLLAARRRRAATRRCARCRRSAGRRARDQRARVRVPRRVRHRADGLRRRRLRRPAEPRPTRRGCSTTCAPGDRCCPRSSSRAGRADRRWDARCSCSTDIDEPGLATLEVYERRGGYESLRKALAMSPEEVLERARSLGPARARRRGLRDGHEGLVPAEGRDGQVPRVQRRRVRAGHVQGPRTDAEDAAHR